MPGRMSVLNPQAWLRSKEELQAGVGREGSLLRPQQAAECTSNREIKANQRRTFGFLCLCHTKIHHGFSSPPVHAQPCPDLTLPLFQHHHRVLQVRSPWVQDFWAQGWAGSSGDWVHQGSTTLCIKPHQDDKAALTWVQRGDRAHPKALRKASTSCWFWVSCPICQWEAGEDDQLLGKVGR